jgi:hypothetical protein
VQLKTSTAAIYLFAGAAILAWLLPRYQPGERLHLLLLFWFVFFASPLLFVFACARFRFAAPHSRTAAYVH